MKAKTRNGLRFPINGPRLVAELAARDLDVTDLAEKTGLDEDTIGRARRGEPISQRSLQLIRDALRSTPIDPFLAAMVGIDPDQEPMQ